MDIKNAVALIKAMPPQQSVLLIGPHGVGKSQVVRQIAQGLHEKLVASGDLNADVPVSDQARSTDDPYVDSFLIDMRLSQQSEGDIIGLPELINGVTRFRPPQWFMTACLEPRVVFLDELNRATPEVMQAAFQIVLDYQLNGYKLHPLTRVYAAVNPDQGGYAVNSMDPALLDRFAVIQLEPTHDDFFTWATGKLLPQIVSFLRANPEFVDPPTNAQPGLVYQSRRSWEMLDTGLRAAGLDECYEKNALFFSMALSRVGMAAATAFQDYVINMERQLTASDITDKWNKKLVKRIDDLGAEKYNILCDKLVKDSSERKWTDKQLKNIAKFVAILPGEHVVDFWVKLSGINNVKHSLDNTIGVFKHAQSVIMEHVTQIAKEQGS